MGFTIAKSKENKSCLGVPYHPKTYDKVITILSELLNTDSRIHISYGDKTKTNLLIDVGVRGRLGRADSDRSLLIMDNRWSTMGTPIQTEKIIRIHRADPGRRGPGKHRAAIYEHPEYKQPELKMGRDATTTIRNKDGQFMSHVIIDAERDIIVKRFASSDAVSRWLSIMKLRLTPAWRKK